MITNVFFVLITRFFCLQIMLLKECSRNLTITYFHLLKIKDRIVVLSFHLDAQAFTDEYTLVSKQKFMFPTPPKKRGDKKEGKERKKETKRQKKVFEGKLLSVSRRAVPRSTFSDEKKLQPSFEAQTAGRRIFIETM
jgi:hypothetical protein